MPENKVVIGDIEITSLSDGLLAFDLCDFFPDISEENWEPYHDFLTPAHQVQFNLACFLIRAPNSTVLVDTGLGPKPTPDTPWGELLKSMDTHGVKPSEIDVVVMTHAHRDHVGWNLTSSNGTFTPTFPNAKYWLSKIDWEICHNPEVTERFPNAPDCVWPLEDLGILELMDGEQSITDHITTIPSPGHTPGHTSLRISSKGEQAIVLGDVLHNPVQAHETEWVSRADMDPAQTRLTRHSLMEQLERDGTLVAAVHMPAPGFGNIVRIKGRRYWQAI